MSLGNDLLLELTIATVGGIATVGYTVLKLAMTGMQKQHEVTKQLIEERFIWAEQRREDARLHWEKHFEEIKETNHVVTNRIYSLENRVMNLELYLAKKPSPYSTTGLNPTSLTSSGLGSSGLKKKED